MSKSLQMKFIQRRVAELFLNKINTSIQQGWIKFIRIYKDIIMLQTIPISINAILLNFKMWKSPEKNGLRFL